MNIITIKVGYLKCNCYILEKENKCLIIDPGDEFDKIINEIKLPPIGILITHNHFDHIGCIDKLKEKYNIKVYDYNNLKEEQHTIDKFKFNVIYTPGHSHDSITYFFKEEQTMFTGDFLFYDTIGRCDLKGSNINEMIMSINKIKKYAGDIKIVNKSRIISIFPVILRLNDIPVTIIKHTIIRQVKIKE